MSPSFLRLACLCIAFALCALPALAQPPAETCGAGDSLSGGDSLPVDLNAVTGVDDFTMTGTGCFENSFDHVTCMTPATSCVVDASCTAFFIVEPSPIEGLQVGINAVEGACNTAPASCLDSGSGTGGGSITGLALTGGTTYCFVCESGDTIDIRLQVTATSGDCGALPVELERFGVD